MVEKTEYEIENLLRPYVAFVSKYGADGKSIQRVKSLLVHLGNPHEKLKIIHIAGTSGKTSTAYYLAHLLADSKLKVGLTVSPHVYSITERVQILNGIISDEIFLQELEIFLENIEKIKIKPSYFELMMAFAFWEFARQGVDYAVVETGMGGLLDASNVARQEDKVCVITDIGFDHMHVLGSTLREISSQKAGIIHSNNYVFMNQQPPEIMSPIQARVEGKSAYLKVIEIDDKNIATNSQLFSYQARNYNLAYRVYECIAITDKFLVAHNFKAEQVKIPARLELIKLIDMSLLIIDGAHNEQKMQAFVSSYRLQFPKIKAAVLIAIKSQKGYRDIINALRPITSQFILTNFYTTENLPANSVNPAVIKKYLDKNTDIDSRVISDPIKATQFLLRQTERVKIITGSFYLISQTKKEIENHF